MIDGRSKWNHRWTTSKAKTNTLKISGGGIVAKEKAATGEMEIICGGLIVPKADVKFYNEHVSLLGIQINDDFFILPPSNEESEIGALNHSCDPNWGSKIS